MNLVPVYAVVRSEQIDLSAQERLRRITLEKQELQAAIRQAQSLVTKLNTDIALRNSDVLAELAAVERELLRHLQGCSAAQDAELDEELDKFYEERDVAEPDPDRKTSDKKLSVLFRKIAARTHPDKTDDSEKHKLFIAAKACKADSDLAGLQRIWDVLCNMASSLLGALLADLQRTTAEVTALRRDYETLIRSDDYSLAVAYQADSKAVGDLFRMQLQCKLRAAKARLQALSGTPPA